MKLSANRYSLLSVVLLSLAFAATAAAQSGGRVASPSFAPAPVQAAAPAFAPSTFSAVGQPIAASAGPVGVTACSPCAQPTVAQPTVAFSPVVAPQPVMVQQPVVLQTLRPTRRLFSGRILRRIFGFRDPVVVAPTAPLAPAPTFVTAAYQPTVPLFTPQVQTVARPVALAATTFRPVALSPVANCPSCCSGVAQASFAAPACPNCAGGATFSSPGFSQSTQPLTPTPSPTPANPLPGETPQPGIAPGAPVPDQRLRPLQPGSDLLDPNDIGPASPASPADGSGTKADAYWQPPQLFNPNARTTSRPAAPVWNAVYQQDGSTSAVSGRVYRVGPEQTANAATSGSRRNAGGWHSVRD